MKNRYYLVSSLYDLVLDEGKPPFSMEDFLTLCEEQLNNKEMEHLKKLFIFNDLRNLTAAQGEPFLNPSYYDQEELAQIKIDPGSSFSFVQKYFLETPGAGPASLDTLMTAFYEELDSFAQGAIKDYFLFELDLRNLSMALVLRKKKERFHDRLIPFGDAVEHILTSTALDFGLAAEFPFVDHLISLLAEKPIQSLEQHLASANVEREPDLTGLEKALDEQRWIWLTENWETSLFDILTIFSYAIKLQMVERWNKLDTQEGKRFFDKIVNQIKNSIVFSDELFIDRGRK